MDFGKLWTLTYAHLHASPLPRVQTTLPAYLRSVCLKVFISMQCRQRLVDVKHPPPCLQLADARGGLRSCKAGREGRGAEGTGARVRGARRSVSDGRRQPGFVGQATPRWFGRKEQTTAGITGTAGQQGAGSRQAGWQAGRQQYLRLGGTAAGQPPGQRLPAGTSAPPCSAAQPAPSRARG